MRIDSAGHISRKFHYRDVGKTGIVVKKSNERDQKTQNFGKQIVDNQNDTFEKTKDRLRGKLQKKQAAEAALDDSPVQMGLKTVVLFNALQSKILKHDGRVVITLPI